MTGEAREELLSLLLDALLVLLVRLVLLALRGNEENGSRVLHDAGDGASRKRAVADVPVTVYRSEERAALDAGDREPLLEPRTAQSSGFAW